MIRSNKQYGKIQINRLMTILENEKKRWQHMGEYNYAWIEKLRKDNAAVAVEFEAALKNVRLAQEKPTDKPSLLLPAIPSAVGALAGFGVPILLKWSMTYILLGGFGLTAIAGASGYGIYKMKMENAATDERKQYVSQLEAIGEILANIVKKAD